MPARRSQRVTSFLVMVRQQRGGLVQTVRMRGFERTGCGRMGATAALLELRAQRHLLRQRMLEAVLRYRLPLLLEDELGIFQRAQRRA